MQHVRVLSGGGCVGIDGLGSHVIKTGDVGLLSRIPASPSERLFGRFAEVFCLEQPYGLPSHRWELLAPWHPGIWRQVVHTTMVVGAGQGRERERASARYTHVHGLCPCSEAQSSCHASDWVDKRGYAYRYLHIPPLISILVTANGQTLSSPNSTSTPLAFNLTSIG